jgi:hypothetical protein
MAGCGVILGLSEGQDGFGAKAKKDKGDKGDHEEKAVMKLAEKATKAPESERDKWLKEMSKAYPGRISQGLSAVDFSQWFDLLSDGRPNWRPESVPNKPLGELYDRAADRLGLGPAAFLRRDEFIRYAMRFLEPGNSPIWKPVDPITEADKVFDKLDRDGSGFLEPEEWTERIRADIRRIDVNRDGRIDRDEYRAYFQGRVLDVIAFGPEPQLTKLAPKKVIEPVEERPYAIRYGKMPPGLPAWFEELDLDKDGQIALWEWRRAGLTISQFKELDEDDDGLITPSEYLRLVKYRRPEGVKIDLPSKVDNAKAPRDPAKK